MFSKHPSSSPSDASTIAADSVSSSFSRRSSSYTDLRNLIVDNHNSKTPPTADAAYSETHFSSSLKLLRENISRPSPTNKTSFKCPPRPKHEAKEEEEEEDDEGLLLDLYYVNNQEIETPRLSKTSCSSLSEFFCKPLIPEGFLLRRVSDDEMLKIAQQENEIFNDPLVIQAFEEASEAHNGQVSIYICRDIV